MTFRYPSQSNQLRMAESNIVARPIKVCTNK